MFKSLKKYLLMTAKKIFQSCSTGFSLLELMIVSAVIIIISGVVVANFRTGFGEQALARAAHKLALDARRAQNMALAGAEVQGLSPCAYALIPSALPAVTAVYALLTFASPNCPSETSLGSGAIEFEVLQTEKDVEISPSSTLKTAIFLPPNAKTVLGNTSNVIVSSGTFILRLKNNPSKTRSVFINAQGQISVQ